jgi:hypothetical protein
LGARTDAVDQAIARAYAVFDLRPPKTLGVCTACCMDPATERAILRKGQSQLSLEDIREWTAAAFRDDMAFDSVAWVLPRILDLLAQGEEVSSNGNEVALSRLPRAGFPGNWTVDQVDAVNAACMAILDRHAARRAGGLDGLLCMFSLGGLPVAPFIARLDALPDEDLAELLHAELQATSGMMVWHTAFWEDHRERDRIAEWYASPLLQDRMANLGYAGNDQAAAVSDALAACGRRRPAP